MIIIYINLRNLTFSVKVKYDYYKVELGFVKWWLLTSDLFRTSQAEAVPSIFQPCLQTPCPVLFSQLRSLLKDSST